MYSISDISKLMGITAYTLRYYEKIGLLPNPKRLDGKQYGIRRYDDQDLRFIKFIHGLKQTGMKLKDIATFVEEGCYVTQEEPEIEVKVIFHKRIDILSKHIEKLEQQLTQLEVVKVSAQDKRNFYYSMLKKHGDEEKKLK
ncbi:MerR family transcriptional regulator [Paenibacillus alginolyticus]|uniref:MerR family transcriptional regulator n=1 Tax=Paenibacillus alginolyticus TaxID=59839 RepID=A0ABT4GIS8_9BACL|nr:MerR family transcriptional regulator [Paenibacillus alginolyticus]MCY9696091.1 MerR family transcriptional regulator [Paenibacillus alginolyticus]MEC0143371.1 MerR family transcriptional regulator [Paenibacillus alginolyticus]